MLGRADPRAVQLANFALVHPFQGHNRTAHARARGRGLAMVCRAAGVSDGASGARAASRQRRSGPDNQRGRNKASWGSQRRAPDLRRAIRTSKWL